jgi:anti-sigma factor RsiW
MKEDQEPLKLQAYLDGELSEAEAREVANWLAQDQDAVALLAELRNTRKAMMGFEEGIKLPESRDFYWSKIRRQIERLEVPREEPAAAVPLLTRVRRFLVPVAGLALLVIVGLVAMQNSSGGRMASETALADDSGAFTYHDFDSGTTLVWLSYPADNELALNDDPDSLE